MQTTQATKKTPCSIVDFFDRIYIINLEKRTDRLTEIQEEFEKIGVDFSHSKIQVFKAIRPENNLGWPTIGTKGCYLSHLGVLKDAQKNQYQRILVLEDDVNFAENFNVLMRNVVHQLETIDWDFFYGGYRVSVQAQDAIEAHYTSDSATKNLYFAPANTQVICCHFFSANQSTISALVTYLEKMMARPMGHPAGGRMHVDGAYSWFRREHPEVHTVLAYPELCYQRSSRTDIHDLKWYDMLPIVKSATETVRKIKNHIF